MSFDQWLNAFLALFAILNPIGNIPLFADFTDSLDRATRFKVFNVVVGTGFATLLIMTLTGRWIMSEVFQIDIAEFRIAGGIVLTVLATRYIVFPPDKPKVDTSDITGAIQMGVVPMAVPLLVGPGSIVTGILILNRDGLLVSLSAIIAVFLTIWVLLQASHVISRVLGRAGKLIVSRILWIFIGAIGVHFLPSGIRELFGIH